MQREIVAPRHQPGVYRRARCRLWINLADRLLWSRISRHWPGWRDFLVFVQPRTVTAWQQARFRDHRRRLSQSGDLKGSAVLDLALNCAGIFKKFTGIKPTTATDPKDHAVLDQAAHRMSQALEVAQEMAQPRSTLNDLQRRRDTYLER